MIILKFLFWRMLSLLGRLFRSTLWNWI